MASAQTHHRHIFQGFDDSVERFLGADMRLIYGIGVPILMVVGLIILLALNPTTWLVVSILLLEVAALGLVVAALFELMRDDEDEDETFSS
jgi:chromate transport protein ChrA